MTRIVGLWVLLLSGVLVAANLYAAELQPADGGAVKDSRRTYRQATKHPSELSLVEPAYKTGNPLYISIGLGDDLDSIISGAVDESGGAGAGYDILYLDANNNGDLTDDEPITFLRKVSPGRGVPVETEPVALTIKYFDGTERRLKVVVSFFSGGKSRSGKTRWMFGYRLVQHLEGRVDLGKSKNVLVGLYDMPSGRSVSNGCFNDYSVDRFRIDLDANGKLDAPREEAPLSRAFCFGGELWELDIDSSASQFSIFPCKLAAGSVKFNAGFVTDTRLECGTIRLARKGGYSFVVEVSEDRALKIPEGSYSVAAEGITLADSTGKKWSTGFSMPTKLKVRPDVDTTVNIGLPMKVKPEIRGAMKPGQRITVSSRLLGAGGEIYDGISCDRRRLPPSVKIVDKEGKVLAEGKMAYG